MRVRAGLVHGRFALHHLWHPGIAIWEVPVRFARPSPFGYHQWIAKGHLKEAGGEVSLSPTQLVFGVMESSQLCDVLRELVDLWVQKRGIRKLPTKKAFDFYSFRPWIGHIGLVDRDADSRELFVRLAGSEIVEYDGADFTGKYMRNCVPSHALAKILYPYNLCIERKCPVFNRLPPGDLRGSFRYFDRLILPCSDDDEFINRFIVSIYVSQFDRHRNRHGIYGQKNGRGPKGSPSPRQAGAEVFVGDGSATGG